MATDERPSSELLAELWTLVETWSSGAIERARMSVRDGDADVVEVEIRSLMDRAMELRSVLDRHDPPGGPAPAAPAPAALAVEEPVRDAPAEVFGLSIFDPRPSTTDPAPGVTSEHMVEMASVADPALETSVASEVRDHRCDSADFERPPCVACGVRHWYCGICGAVRDECLAELRG
jgi:hypothetical protein